MTCWLFAALTAMSLNGPWSFTHDTEGKSGWRDVEVPHDWAIAGPFDPGGECRTGKLPWKGKGLYRREFVVPGGGWKTASLWFGGAMCWPRVMVNGVDVGGWDYGYASFRLDVTKALRPGTNTVEVALDTTPLKARFYPGAGLYRDVELTLYGADEHLIPDSVFITTPEVTAERATVVVEYETTKGRGRRESVVEKPRLWDVDDPHLYETELFGEKFRYGIRKAEFTADDGFHLNGRRVQLKGVNLHADLGPLGMAFNRSAARRQLEIMKDMGVNALRTSHNFPDRAMLDLCDEMGILVWDEAFDKWDETAARKPEQDVDEFARRNIEQLVRRDRNHPCVVVWSIGNEICETGVVKRGETVSTNLCTDGVSAERCAMLRDAVRALDPTRPVGIGCCFMRQVAKGILDCMDLTGWNYGRGYRVMRERRPDMPLVYSESASAVSGYGEYELPPAAYPVGWNTNRWTVDAFEHCASPWSDIPEVEFNRMETDRYVAGEFVWTGIDYLGEPTPFNSHGLFPNVPPAKLARSSYFGICDLNVLPKDRYWLYRSYWNPGELTLEIAPHWNWKGRKGEKIPVYVYTNGDEAELFLNGRSLGRRRKQLVPDYSPVRGKDVNKAYADFRDNPYYAICDRYRLRWLDVPYEPGELRVVAWNKGMRIGEKAMRTADRPVAVRLSCDRASLPADGETLAWVEVDLVDAAGTREPLADNDVAFRLDGPGRIVAVANGDARSCKSFAETSHHPLYNGKAVAVARREKGRSGTIRLVASATGMRDGVLELAETVVEKGCQK